MIGGEKILAFCEIFKCVTAAGILMYILQQEYICIGCILVLEVKANLKTHTILNDDEAEVS